MKTPLLVFFALLFLTGVPLGCETKPPKATAKQRSSQKAALPKAKKAASGLEKGTPGSLSKKKVGAPKKPDPAQPARCPEGMRKIPGGTFWVGTENEVYDREENPRFSTKLPDFCADEFEVSTSQYEQCAAAGACAPLSGRNQTCNTSAKGRGDHPVNCIDFSQAQAVCAQRSARLPSEVEWEYLARGGEQMRRYPWGDEPPDGRTCWKHAGTCERGSFAPGAFGLHDVVGNVWEWTSSWFGRYPWPAQQGRHRVYRGGSWSRRFAKWMRPSLRNRLDPAKSGSHLGVRCVASLPQLPCPYGKDERGLCRFGVEEVHCLDQKRWNGVRCAQPDSVERCAPPAQEVPGFGCVRPRTQAKAVEGGLDTSAVSRSRSPEFDVDCQANAPGRPVAYRFVGGGHLARNLVGKQLGCKNRDVGVGFNSSCCPQ